MPDSYGQLIVDVHKAFENEPEKAGAVTRALDHLVDRVKYLERQVVDLTVAAERPAARPTEPEDGTLR